MTESVHCWSAEDSLEDCTEGSAGEKLDTVEPFVEHYGTATAAEELGRREAAAGPFDMEETVVEQPAQELDNLSGHEGCARYPSSFLSSRVF